MKDSPLSKEAEMEGLTALLGITLANINLCCIVYLAKSGMKAVLKLMEIKGLLDNE